MNILIKRVELPKHSYQHTSAKRCSKFIRASSPNFTNRRCQCERFARFGINGYLFCTQHAGEFTLEYLIKEQEKTGVSSAGRALAPK